MDIWESCHYCLQNKYTVLFPKIVGKRKMIFVQIKTLKNQFQKNQLDIFEPCSNVAYSKKIDLILIPGIAFDNNLNRIGYGGGYYDTFLNQLNYQPDTLGLFFNLQKTQQNITTSLYDIPLQKIITETIILE